MMSTSTEPAEEAAPSAALPEWVVFSCAGRLLAIPLLLTREVVPPQPLTRLPGCGPEVAGLMGLRGRVVTVFDMGAVLSLQSALRLPDYRTIVLDHEQRMVGIAVDQIEAIAHADAAVLQSADAALGELESMREDVVGLGSLGGRPFLALDPNRILSRLLV
jgi:purine-binding chemotaxis protein CheW